jgi:shikimate dehydrogenase
MADMMTIDGKTQLIGLIGWPVSHSFSPAMHNAAALDLGLNYVYIPMPVHPHNLQSAVQGIAALGFKGINVTVPHKQAIMPFLDTIEPGAKLIGAVNTVVVTRNTDAHWQLAGHNTDWLGFLADLNFLQVNINQRDCLVLGAGGSARAIVYALAQAGAKIHLLARRIVQAENLAADFSQADLSQADLSAHIHANSLSSLPSLVTSLEAPLIINTTPLGMTPDIESSVWPDAVPLPAGSVVYDLVYNPLQTRLMQQAKAAGCMASNGLGMLIHQGALAFELWTEQKPQIQVMKEALQLA